MKQKGTYLYNNTYNQGCCRVCRRVCEKPCKVKVTTDSGGVITGFRVNGKKIRILEYGTPPNSLKYNGRAIRNNEYVLMYIFLGNITEVRLVSNRNDVTFYIKDLDANIERGKKNLKKLKCALSRRTNIASDKPIKATLIRNNTIIKKNGKLLYVG